MSATAVVKTKQEKPEPLELVRLPWHDDLAIRFGDLGVEKATWKVLAEAVWPSAKTTDSIVMALSYCKARRLDPFKRVVHIVPVWDSNSGGMIETVWPSISEMRTTAFRTGQYAGCDETKFGPDITKTFKGKVKRDKQWVDIEKTVTFPEWAQITVYRLIAGQRAAFVGPRVYWLETYARMGRSDVPNEMWERRARGQPEKCAEAGALRKAFPEELGNEYAAEEMEGQRLWHEMRDVTPKAAAVAVVAAASADIPEAVVPPAGKAQVEPVEPAAKQVETAAKAAPVAKPADDAIPEDDDWPGPKDDTALIDDLTAALAKHPASKVEAQLAERIKAAQPSQRENAIELLEKAKKRR